MSFELDVLALRASMEPRGKEALEEYNKLGKAQGLAKKLQTDTEKGINNSNEEISRRTKAFGANFIPPKKPKTFWELAIAAVEDLTLQILIGCAIVSIALAIFNFFAHQSQGADLQCLPRAGAIDIYSLNNTSINPDQITKNNLLISDPTPEIKTTATSTTTNTEEIETSWLVTYAEFIEGAMIVAAILLVILVTAANDYAKEKQFRGLQDQLSAEQKASVIRSGENIEIPVADLLVGDICQIKYGDLLPADGFLIQSNDLKVDESSLTGESDHVKKGVDRDPALLGGTHIMEGSGRMIVTAVGQNSQSGIIFMLLGAAAEQEGEEEDEQNILEKNNQHVESGKGKYTLKNRYDDVVSLDLDFSTRLVFCCMNVGVYCLDFLIWCKSCLKWIFCCHNNINSFFSEFLGTFNQPTDAEITPLKEQKNADDDQENDADDEGEKSILQKKLDLLTVQIGYIGTIACVLTIVVLLIRLILKVFLAPVYDSESDNIEGNSISPNERYPFSDCYLSYLSTSLGFLIIGVTVLVVAIPEGLPLAVTISLAFSVKKMMKDNNLVRHLDSCETMGNATAICSDKTGTLTTNRMTVVQSFFCSKYYKDCSPNPNNLSENMKEVLMQGIAINTNYTSKILPPLAAGGEPQQVGNKTECALLGFLNAININNSITYEKLRLACPETKFAKVYTFNSARKSMSTIIDHPTDANKYRMYTKGASEIIVGKCQFCMDGDGKPVKFSSKDKNSLQKKVIEPMAKDALRTIGLAFRDISKAFDLENEEELMKNMTLIGIVGIEDPVRGEVPAAIRKCQSAGITVRMVTGDNLVTARSIAVKCGIISKDDTESIVMEGKFFLVF